MKRSVRNPSNFRVGDRLTQGVRGLVDFVIIRITKDRVYFKTLSRSEDGFLPRFDTYRHIEDGAWTGFEFVMNFNDYYEELKGRGSSTIIY